MDSHTELDSKVFSKTNTLAVLRRAHPKGGRRKGRRPRTGDLIVQVSRRGLLVVGGGLVNEALPRGEHVQDGGHAVRGRAASSASSSSRPSGNTRVRVKPGFNSKRHGQRQPACVPAFVSRPLATRTLSHRPLLRASFFARLACSTSRFLCISWKLSPRTSPDR